MNLNNSGVSEIFMDKQVFCKFKTRITTYIKTKVNKLDGVVYEYQITNIMHVIANII